MKEIIILILMFIPSMVFLLPLVHNMLLADYEYHIYRRKYPFRLRARNSFIIGMILFIIPLFFIR